LEGGTTREEKRSLQSKIRHRRYEDVIAMLDKGISTEVRDEFGNTTLMLAAQAGSKRMCKILMRHGADLNARNNRGQTALHFCYSFRYVELGDYLRAKGADDMILNDHGLTCYEVRFHYKTQRWKCGSGSNVWGFGTWVSGFWVQGFGFWV